MCCSCTPHPPSIPTTNPTEINLKIRKAVFVNLQTYDRQPGHKILEDCIRSYDKREHGTQYQQLASNIMMRLSGQQMKTEKGKNLPQSFDLLLECHEAFLWLSLHLCYSQRSQSQNPVVQEQRCNSRHRSFMLPDAFYILHIKGNQH